MFHCLDDLVELHQGGVAFSDMNEKIVKHCFVGIELFVVVLNGQ